MGISEEFFDDKKGGNSSPEHTQIKQETNREISEVHTTLTQRRGFKFREGTSGRERGGNRSVNNERATSQTALWVTVSMMAVNFKENWEPL